MDTRSFALIAIAVSLTAIGAPSAGLAQQRSLDGGYKGSLECQQMPEDIGLLRLPLAIVVRNGRVVASAPMFDIDGKKELTATVATGTLNAEGAFHVGVTVFIGDASAHVDYTGTLDGDGGTLKGMQVWSRATAGESGPTRTCSGTLAEDGYFGPSPNLPPGLALPFRVILHNIHVAWVDAMRRARARAGMTAVKWIGAKPTRPWERPR
jgi:hypothetical protein